MRRFLVATVCVMPMLWLAAGCYETQYPLGAESKATVNPNYVGDYAMTEGNKTNSLIIRNIDNHLYYVEWVEDSSNDEPLRLVGYIADVNGVTFANLRKLSDDGTIDNKYLVMRIGLSADHRQLTLRNLKEGFFKDKKIDSTETMEKLVSANLENPQMYDGDAATATRVTPPAGHAESPPP